MTMSSFEVNDASPGPTVSVVIPVYNALATLGRTLEAVYAQTYPNLIEVIVADDGSTEDTGYFLARHFPQVRFAPLAHTGNPAHVRNQGVALATGEFLAFVDADDVWLPDKLRRQVEVVVQQPEVAFVTTRYNRVNTAGDSEPPVPLNLGPVFRLDLHRWLLTEYRCRIGVLGFPSGWLLSRVLFHELGGFDPSWGRQMEDTRFLLRAMLKGHLVAVIADPLYNYLVSPKSLSQAVSTKGRGELEAGMIAFLLEQRPLIQAAGGPIGEAEYELLVFKEASAYARSPLQRGCREEAAHLASQALQCRVSLWRKLLLRPTLALFALGQRLLGNNFAPLLRRLWRRR